MNRRTILIALVSCGLLLGARGAFAQATRTWVSGVGDDANPCSRTAPCKTFAGAISKTAANGEINVLDPGGFGAVTITKSITISSECFEAGVLVSGTNGIIVNAAASDVVVLRGLDIEGLGTGLNGIQYLNAGAVFVEKCTINNFTQSGINVATTSAGEHQLFVTDTIIRRCGTSAGNATGGIDVHPTGGGTARATVDNTRLERNFFGMRVMDNAKGLASRTNASSNTSAGFLVNAQTATGELNLEACIANFNQTNGVKADGAFATARLSNLTTEGNVSFGITNANGGVVQTFGNNKNNGNGTNGGPTVGVTPQQ